MAVIKKDKYLKDIASHLHKGALYFEAKDRPAVQMGRGSDGKPLTVYVSSVSFDQESGQLTYKVADAQGAELPSAHGLRPLVGLDVNTLSRVSDTARKYAELRSLRERNMVTINARLKAVRKPVGPSVG